MIGLLLTAIGLGVAAKQELERTFDCIDSRDKAKREGRKTYVDGYGSTRWTENAHQLIRSVDDKGYPCWYDLETHKIVDRFGWNNYGREEYRKKMERERERERRWEELQKEGEELDRLLEKHFKK